MKKKLKAIILSSLVLFLVACGTGSDSSQEDSGQSGSQGDGQNYDLGENVSDDYYQPAISEDGTYPASKNRGVTLQLNSNINLNLFEDDLTRLSKDHFSTDDHYFREGQYLPADLTSTWLGRESEDNPDGLNPPENDSTDPEERVPNYLSSILEHDYYTMDENGNYQLAGISIGLAMNSVDYYSEYQYGPTLEQEIPREEILAQGERMADEIASRMREIEGVGDVPIMFGLYEQTTSDDLAGGVYLSRGMSDNGADSVSNWESLNEERMIFPLEGGESPEANAFENFRTEVKNFFPNLSGVTGRAHYKNDALIDLNIEIMTQFYGHSEMVAFTQFLNSAGNNILPNNIELTITVQSQNGIESFLQRDANEENFYFNVFN